MARLTDLDVSNEGITYLDAKQAIVAGVPCLILRIGFVGELGYELHFAEPVRRVPLGHDPRARRRPRHPAVRARAAADPPPREDAHPRRPGHRLRVERARGRHAVDRQARQGRLRRQVGARARPGAGLPRAARRLRDDERRRSGRGRPDRASSGKSSAASRAPAGARSSASAIGMAWVPPELAEEGADDPDQSRRQCSRRRACGSSRSSTLKGNGSGHDRARLPLPRPGRALGSVSPGPESPMHRRLTEAGAEFEEHDGWLVATTSPARSDIGLRSGT